MTDFKGNVDEDIDISWRGNPGGYVSDSDGGTKLSPSNTSTNAIGVTPNNASTDLVAEHGVFESDDEDDIESRQPEEVLKRILDMYETGEVTVTDLTATVACQFFDKYLPISLSSVRYSTPVPEQDDYTYSDLLGEVRLYKDTWEASDEFEMLEGLLELTPIHPIRKIVGFACSTMEMSRDAYNMRDQLAFILAIRDLLIRREHGPLSCYVQDPSITDILARAVKHEGITVVDDPEGFLQLDEATAVVSLTPIQPVRQITADITRPAMMIWPRGDSRIVHVKNYRADIDDPSSPRVVRMLEEEYVELPFPAIEFVPKQRLAVYIRKQRYNAVGVVQHMLIGGGSNWI